MEAASIAPVADTPPQAWKSGNKKLARLARLEAFQLKTGQGKASSQAAKPTTSKQLAKRKRKEEHKRELRAIRRQTLNMSSLGDALPEVEGLAGGAGRGMRIGRGSSARSKRGVQNKLVQAQQAECKRFCMNLAQLMMKQKAHALSDQTAAEVIGNAGSTMAERWAALRNFIVSNTLDQEPAFVQHAEGPGMEAGVEAGVETGVETGMETS
ncbi:MAG: hypothetical protein M1829_005393 [Trizodia sp. TS-e1964]|nr:MAG: hypothetical protein M1829_005393 [Trizodia sp. TS-e1964]